MIPLAPAFHAVAALADLARALVPEPDPELRRLRAEQHAAMARLRAEHRHAERMARIQRDRRRT